MLHSDEAVATTMADSPYLSGTVPRILWLSEPDCADPDQVGGKAAQLGRLAGHFPVPPGFCLPATTVGSLATRGSAASSALLDLLRPAYAHLSEKAGTLLPRVAVRSSAVDEDGARASFAGQNETYLNLAGAEEIAEAVLRCWNSSRSERALAYRREFGLSGDTIQLAVLVQQLVRADASAVAFSANPVSGSRDEILVNATIGLGESLVGGTVTPDSWRVDKDRLTIIDTQIGDKRRMTIAMTDGTREVDVPRVLRQTPSLKTDQVIELAKLARSLERVSGWPVDVEVAYSGGKLYLLQCRPITSGIEPVTTAREVQLDLAAGR